MSLVLLVSFLVCAGGPAWDAAPLRAMSASSELTLGLRSAPLGDEVDDLIKEFTSILKDKERENEAIAMIDQMVARHQTNARRVEEIDEDIEIGTDNEKELKKERKGIQKVQTKLSEGVFLSFKYRKRANIEGNQRIWKAALFGFGQMGSDGAKFLWKAFDDKRFNKDVAFRALCVQQVGFTKDETQMTPLLDMLDYKDEEVIAAAGEALAQFESAPGKKRHEAVGQLVKHLESYYNAATDLNDSNSKRIYRKVREPLTRALRNLSGESFSDPLDWTRWWNKNKKNAEIWKDKD